MGEGAQRPRGEGGRGIATYYVIPGGEPGGTIPQYLAHFVGAYNLERLSVQISIFGNKLVLLPRGQTPSALEPDLGDELVAVRQRSVRVRFKEDEKGDVVGLYLIQEGEGVIEGKRK